MIDTSKAFKNAVINLYRKGIYTVDYAIIKAGDLADRNKINANDYEELITYLIEEQEKEMQEDVEEVEAPSTEDTAQDNAEDTTDTTEENEVE